jgi:hypothetical protein
MQKTIKKGDTPQLKRGRLLNEKRIINKYLGPLIDMVNYKFKKVDSQLIKLQNSIISNRNVIKQVTVNSSSNNVNIRLFQKLINLDLFSIKTDSNEKKSLPEFFKSILRKIRIIEKYLKKMNRKLEEQNSEHLKLVRYIKHLEKRISSLEKTSKQTTNTS